MRYHLINILALTFLSALSLSLTACTDGGSTYDECTAFCTPSVVTAVDSCFAEEGSPIDQQECIDVCMEEGFGGQESCVMEAGSDCAAVSVCLAPTDDSVPPVTFDVQGEDALMNGVIDARTITAVEDLLENHPEVTRIVLQDCPGSMDDTSNLRASRLIRAAGLATHVPADGVIASGAVDFFLAGTTRTADVAGGAKLGVHSWGGDDGLEGADVPRDSALHTPYLDYYAEMGIPADFYWFTLEAASADDIHWMTADEVAQYQLLTE